MNNLHLFELINARPGLSPGALFLATLLAQWLIYGVPFVMVAAWVRGDRSTRQELLQMLLAVAISLSLAQVIAHLWPQPRPAALQLGTQYLAHGPDPGLPSDHVTVLWSLAFAALRTQRLALWGFPLLALGLLIGWSRVYLGVHFPFDVLAALPVGWAGAIIAGLLSGPLQSAFLWTLDTYERLTDHVRGKLRDSRKI